MPAARPRRSSWPGLPGQLSIELSVVGPGLHTGANFLLGGRAESYRREHRRYEQGSDVPARPGGARPRGGGVGWTAPNVPRRRRRQWFWQRRRSRISTASGIRSQPRALRRKAARLRGIDVFRDPNESDRVWAILTGTRRAAKLHLDPRFPAIFQEAGFTQGPQVGGIPPRARRLDTLAQLNQALSGNRRDRAEQRR